MSTEPVAAEVLAVIVALVDGQPCALVVADPPRLPSGPLLPGHRSLQTAVRAWLEDQTGLHVGHLEQLYTFADSDRAGTQGRTISVSYLGLVPGAEPKAGRWQQWYALYPWEDQRDGNALLPDIVAPALRAWVNDSPRARRTRCAVNFGLDGRPWQPDLALQRYEVLYEAGLVPESPAFDGAAAVPGDRMAGDHRRVLATGIARLRATIQYRPVVFELMPPTFTLGQLQACVEALAGRGVHTQNFRRLVEQQQLVEPTGATADTGGRPARLYRFRRDVLQERQAVGTKLPAPRSR